MAALDPAVWRGRKVLLTGHTGFKGSWLTALLQTLGAEVAGVALPPDTQPSHIELLKPKLREARMDIRDREGLKYFTREFQPEIVLHLAAQSLVLRSYQDPATTFETNVTGTLNVFEAVRACESVRSVVVVTSDKCYENDEQGRPFNETDRMGGHDPYSASKGCTELLVSSYQRSFFNPEKFSKDHHTLVGSARAGNVIGGGDWCENRLIPDFARALAKGQRVEIRNPEAVRPWQHVLDPIYGYLLLAERLYKGERQFAEGWNFGPTTDNCWKVSQIIELVRKHWPEFRVELVPAERHEAKFLMLDSQKAYTRLDWHPRLPIEKAIEWTLTWYYDFVKSKKIKTAEQIDAYLNL